MKQGAALVVIVLLGTSFVAAGCGGSSKSSASQTASTTTSATDTPKKPTAGGTHVTRLGPCLTAPSAVQRTLARNLVLVGARLSHARMVQIPGDGELYAVSARVSGMGKPNAVATWLVPGLEGKGNVFAIDADAELISQSGGATGKYPDLTVDAPGVQKSRVCAGGPNVEHGVTASPPGGPGTPG